ncbi:MAG: NusG domain II-containing protein [Clostridia bacterium]|nr:NusG domain II-containing protein [Clostridia bacterium]
MSNKKLIVIFAVIFVTFVAAAIILSGIQPEGNIAIISVGAKQIKEVDLSEDQTFDINTELGTNTVTVSDGEIYVSDADCPDRLCIRHGKLNNKYDSIVCLPNKLVIEYKNGSGVDAVAGR